MEKAILGKKIGMTQIFDEQGNVIPVTVIKAGPCTVIQKKTEDTDGYQALQVGFEDQKEKRVNKPRLGHFKKAKVSPKKFVKEIYLADMDNYEEGQEIKADIFKEGEFIDVSSVSKGKGFTGTVKRHGQGRGPMTHGSHHHRGPGSLGSVDAARVFKGQALPGRMGADKVTIQKLRIAKVYPDRDLILVKGSVPGPRGVYVVIKDSVKKNKNG